MQTQDINFEIAQLISKFLKGTLSPEESKKLLDWIEKDEQNKKTFINLTDSNFLENKLKAWENHPTDIHWKNLHRKLQQKPVRPGLILKKAMRYAAVILPIAILAGVGWYLTGQNKTAEHQKDFTQTSKDISIFPKGKVASLVLGNGKVVELKDSLDEIINENNGTQVSRKKSILFYTSNNGPEPKKEIFNTLRTPKGGEYRVVLADGTKVWLNAASSLKYPTRFTGKERKVYLSGEACFEVAKDVQHPFIVNAGEADIRVLGTKFNVSAYADDKRMITTLVEGAVGVKYSNNNEDGVVLKPGFEAVLTNGVKGIELSKADVNAALAWTEGLFIFNSETLTDIMKKLSRWYDVDIEYGRDVDTIMHFTGRVRKYENISGILEKLEMTKKIRFNVIGHEVQVLPYNK